MIARVEEVPMSRARCSRLVWRGERSEKVVALEWASVYFAHLKLQTAAPTTDAPELVRRRERTRRIRVLARTRPVWHPWCKRRLSRARRLTLPTTAAASFKAKAPRNIIKPLLFCAVQLAAWCGARVSGLSIIGTASNDSTRAPATRFDCSHGR
jgi:hypothetical protein